MVGIAPSARYFGCVGALRQLREQHESGQAFLVGNFEMLVLFIASEAVGVVEAAMRGMVLALLRLLHRRCWILGPRLWACF